MNCLEHPSPVGLLLLAASSEGLTHLLFADDDGRPLRAKTRPRSDDGPAATTVLRATLEQLDAYFAGTRRDFDLPLAPSGTPFQRDVWQALSDLPYGSTTSYRNLAHSVQRPRAVRAVGAANGANPISIIVPCHRVIGHDGRLTGYGGGLPAKRHLLKLEGLETLPHER
ncbi:MAG: methylated-DNA--[protein]-cysteine S-methyltransferase [Myxococcota bacterium]